MVGKQKKRLKRRVCAGIVGLALDRKSKEMKKLLSVLIVLGLCGTASAMTVPILSFENERETIITTPGSAVILNIETDSPLSMLDAIIRVDGDALITGAMSQTDCGAYGWDP
jgi:hypothetical protein